MTSTASQYATCQHLFEAWGPNEGCAEFMSEPDRFPCGKNAIVKFVFKNLYAEGEVVLDLCKAHAEAHEAQAEPGELLRQIPFAESMEIEHENGEPTTLIVESRFVSGYKGETAHRVKDVETGEYVTEDLSPKQFVQWILDRELSPVASSGRTIF